MAQYDPHPYPVGEQAAPFLTNHAPVTGTIGPDPQYWTLRAGYVAPYRSFFQQLVNANYSLGPYARAVGSGLSGRIVNWTGETGFAQQCWYDFPRGPLEQAYEENWEWWGGTEKVRIVARNLISDDPNDNIVIEVAISNHGSADPKRYGPLPRVGLFLNRGVNSIAFAIWGGDCGISDVPNWPLPSSNVDYLPRVPWMPIAGLPIPNIPPVIWHAISGFGGGAAGDGNDESQGGGAGDPDIPDNPFTNDSPWEDFMDKIFGTNGTNDSGELGAGRNEFLDGIKNTMGNRMDAVMDALTAAVTDMSGLSDTERENLMRQTGELMVAIHEGTDLFIKGWLTPNILEVGKILFPDLPINVKGLSSDDAYPYRPNEYTQIKWASYLASSLNTTDGTYIEGIPRSTPTNEFGQRDPMWFVTMLNRGSTASPYVDSATNELVIPENYGFNRGGSIAQTDDFLDGVQAHFGQSTADSVGTLFDMSPFSGIFVVTAVPILTLEAIARARKGALGETINPVTNLDGLRDTKFDARISAKNLKRGNPDLYANLVNEGLMQEVD